jgi:ammonium transporter, Amt family
MFFVSVINSLVSRSSAILRLLNGYRVTWGLTIFLLLAGRSAFAQDTPPPVLDSGDTAWLLTSTAMVMLMTPGLALFYAGMVRKKNVLSSIMHSFAALAVVGLQWVIIGYSLAFGEGNAVIGDLSHFFLIGLTPESLTGTIPTYLFMWFQGMFAILTPALISGTIAERTKFSAYVIFIALWATVVYDPVAHWVWGGGWIQKMGALDFAGGTVVHLSSGASALALALLLGKRLGYPGEAFIPHNLTMTILGVAMLWFGWFGFNAGSALAANASACVAFTTTMIASVAAAFSWMMMEWIFHNKPSALGLGSGSIAGLVVITPAAGFVSPTWAIVLGLSAGVLCYYGIRIKMALKFDDSLDVVGIHGIGGAWGAIGTGLFASLGGTGLVLGNPGQVWIQLISVVVVAAYAFIMTYVIGLLIDKTIGFRVDEEQEVIGLDRELHGEVGYTL